MTHRFLQGGPPLPNYTSPPLADALALTPVDFRNDAVIQGLREAHTAGNCNASYPCVIPFLPTSTTKASPVGVLFYGGALVDPRSYAPLCHLLASRYGLPVAVPVFGADIAFTGCNSTGITLDRVSAAIPSVQKWVLVGHSLGGVTGT